MFNEYFSGLCSVEDDSATLPEFNFETQARLSDIPIVESQILDILSCLEVGKANGPDEISTKLLKLTAKPTAKVLYIIFRKVSGRIYFP